jgi:hypothetical protein
MLTVECRNNHIVAIQCLQTEFGEDLNAALAYGRKDADCIIEKNSMVTAYLDLLCHYRPFVDDLNTAVKLVFTGSDTSFDVTQEVLVKNPGGGLVLEQFIITVPAGSGEAQAASFYADLFETSQFQELYNEGKIEVAIDGACIYVWYYEALDLDVTIGDPSLTIQSIKDSPCEILDLINCLSRDQICAILKKVYGLFGLNSNVAADNGSGPLFTLPGGIGATPPTAPVILTINVTTLPPSVGTNVSALFVNVTSQTADLEVFGWTPTGLQTGAHVRVRKANTDPYKILFTDGVNDYDFVNQESEYMDFVWDGTKLVV